MKHQELMSTLKQLVWTECLWHACTFLRWEFTYHSSGYICCSALNSNSFSTIVHIYQPQRIHGNLTLCAPQVQCSGVLLVMCCHVWNFKMVGANELIIGSIAYVRVKWAALICIRCTKILKRVCSFCIDHKASKCHSYPIWRISQYFKWPFGYLRLHPPTRTQASFKALVCSCNGRYSFIRNE